MLGIIAIACLLCACSIGSRPTRGEGRSRDSVLSGSLFWSLGWEPRKITLTLYCSDGSVRRLSEEQLEAPILPMQRDFYLRHEQLIGCEAGLLVASALAGFSSEGSVAMAGALFWRSREELEGQVSRDSAGSGQSKLEKLMGLGILYRDPRKDLMKFLKEHGSSDGFVHICALQEEVLPCPRPNGTRTDFTVWIVKEGVRIEPLALSRTVSSHGGRTTRDPVDIPIPALNEGNAFCILVCGPECIPIMRGKQWRGGEHFTVYFPYWAIP
jgi:hypothetical protein